MPPSSVHNDRQPVVDGQPTVISSRAPLRLSVPAETAGSPDSEQSPPARLGHFELTGFVGGGGMGRVFRARDTALDRIVAIKVLPRDQAGDPALVARFRNEAQSAARLNHENIIQVFHVGEADGLPYIVFEFVEGLNIRSLVAQKGTLPLAEALSYTYEVARALTHVAASGVVHRDVKPSNVLVTPDGRVKLIDMGLARVQKPAAAAADLTASGVTLGTFDYISPEQARDPRTADVRSDIYSLGCTLYYMLAGRPPFPEGTVLQKLLQHQGEKPPGVQEFRPDLPDGVSHLVLRMMAKDPRRRFQTPAELIEGLSALADEVGLAPASLGRPGWVVPRHPKLRLLQQHIPWLAPLALLLATVLALQFVRWPSNDSTDAPRLLIGQPDELAPRGPDDRPPAEKVWIDPGEPVLPPDVPESPPSKSKSSKGAASKGGISRGAALRPAAAEGGLSLSDPAVAGAWMADDVPFDRGEWTAAADSPLAMVPPPGPAGAAAAKNPIAGVLVVDGAGGKPGRFATLQAACRAVANNGVIELRYNGPREERPIALGNVKLTIRAGRGYRPVVVFRPAAIDPAEYPRTMIALTGGHLTLVEVALELVVPRETAAEGWSLLELRQTEQTRLDKCTLTIRGASPDQGAARQDAAFFHVKSPPGGDTADLVDPPAGRAWDSSSPTQAIVLSDCVVRGEAVVLRVQQGRRLQFTWTNGLLVTSEHFLAADAGSRDADIGARIPSGELLKVELQHVTAAIGGGLGRFVEGGPAARARVSLWNVSSCILIGSFAAPLIEQTGVADADSARQRILWNGDRNFYEGFSHFWSIQFASPETPPQSMTFDAWQVHWGPEHEIGPLADSVRWNRLPAADRPLCTVGPADYALAPSSPSETNPATRAGNDGRDAGAQIDRLPDMPPLSPER